MPKKPEPETPRLEADAKVDSYEQERQNVLEQTRQELNALRKEMVK